MRTHRLTAAIASLFLLSTPALAMAAPADMAYPRPVPAPKPGDTKLDVAAGGVTAPKPGDTKLDAPGASRTPRFDAPATIQVVRPERTIVRDVDDALPTILAGLALLVAVGGAGLALVRTRSLQRGAVGRTH